MNKINLIRFNLNKLYITIIIILANTTGVLILMLFFLFQKRKYTILDYLFILVSIYSIIITFCNVYIIKDVEPSCFFGIYYYTIPCLIFLNRNHSFFKESDFFFKLFFVFLSISSLYAIFQMSYPNSILPPDGIRACGLMKSTLNYSGLIGITFFPFLVLKFKHKIYKIMGFLLIVCGGFLSLSRGLITNIVVGFLSSYPIQLILQKKISKKSLKNLLIYSILSVVFLIIVIEILNKLGLINMFERLFHIVDYKNDAANSARYDFWISFGDYFLTNPFGYGVGRLISGTSYVSNSMDFESYVLGTLYSIGFMGFVYFAIPFVYVYNQLKRCSAYNHQTMIMFLSGIAIQNIVQAPMITPTTLVMTWLNLIFFVNHLFNMNKVKYE